MKDHPPVDGDLTATGGTTAIGDMRPFSWSLCQASMMNLKFFKVIKRQHEAHFGKELGVGR